MGTHFTLGSTGQMVRLCSVCVHSGLQEKRQQLPKGSSPHNPPAKVQELVKILCFSQEMAEGWVHKEMKINNLPHSRIPTNCDEEKSRNAGSLVGIEVSVSLPTSATKV